MRLFIALELEELADYFKELQQKVPKAKATYPKQFHLTLKFLGDVQDNKLAEIKEKLKQVKFEPFQLKLGKTGVFPSEKFIRVVWVGLEDGEKIKKLQEQIEKALEGIFEKDSRFHPHITLARIKFIEEDKKEEFIKSVKAIEIEPKETKIKNFKLIKSILTGEGPVYEDLEVYG
ncbi:RNA 2',3'-cyclic phosphodiesterase [Candidatus Woesearchaeota archaeon]|nr:RNA 2',3'-cyclic phosphodiesterase [Candidatus Woesearchaeota archaeon]